MQKQFKNIGKKAVEGSNYLKFTQPKVSRGKTAFPTGSQQQRQLGVRYDYDGEVNKDGVDCHKFNIQPNAGDDIPSTIKKWRQDNGGTHAIMARLYVKKDGTKDDVEKSLDEAHKTIEG